MRILETFSKLSLWLQCWISQAGSTLLCLCAHPKPLPFSPLSPTAVPYPNPGWGVMLALLWAQPLLQPCCSFALAVAAEQLFGWEALVCEQWWGSAGGQAVFMVSKAPSWHCLPEQAALETVSGSTLSLQCWWNRIFQNKPGTAFLPGSSMNSCLVCLGIATVPTTAMQQLPVFPAHARKKK